MAARKPQSKKSVPAAEAATPRKTRGKPKLLSGGNPQIAKGDGDAPVQAYIAALAGWKREAARRIDALVTRAAPGSRKAVKWNSPFYGTERGWFFSMHAFTHYLKLTFFNGTQLKPMPPVGSKSPDVRYVDLHEDDTLDEQQLTSWVRQAAKLPGWSP